MTRLAITGCNGRVGRRVVNLALKRGYTVVGIDVVELPEDTHKAEAGQFTYHNTNLADYDALLKILSGCDAVIALAGVPNPADFKVLAHNNNVVISWNILRACAELGINRVVQASSVNSMTMAFSQSQNYCYFPIDESHPCTPDEPYGLSKLIMETQADTIVRRYPSMRVASLRLHYSVPDRSVAYQADDDHRKTDLWGYVHQDSAADAFLLAAICPTDEWASAHEPFLIVAPITASDADSGELWKKYWPDVPMKNGWRLQDNRSFFNCSKAERLLGWTHDDGL